MKLQLTFYRSILVVTMATLLMLSVPLIAMQVTNEVNWSITDFIIMGVLLFCTGMLLMIALRSRAHMAYLGGMLVAISATFLMIWANLAVGLIGAGPNPGNLLYLGVIAVLLAGIYLSRFKPAGMELAMYAAAGALVLHTGIALLLRMQDYPGSSVVEIIAVNLFFATPYIVAGLLFRYVALAQRSAG